MENYFEWNEYENGDIECNRSYFYNCIKNI